MKIEGCRAQNKGIRVARHCRFDDVARRIDNRLQRIEVRVEVESAECGDSAHNM